MKSTTEAAVQKANRQLLEAIRKLPQQPLIVAGVLAGFAFFGSFFLLSSQAAAPGAGTAAYFALETAGQTKPFVIALHDPARIDAARKFSNNPWTVTGIIVKEKANYNADWSYHLDPGTVEFVERPGASCDAPAPYIEENLVQVGENVLPGGRWCPSGVTGLREVSP
jgi:hypothetical protein